MNLKQVLKEKNIPACKSFDEIGDIAIIETPDERYEEIIGKELLDLHKNINTVFSKKSERHGKFRTRKLKLIAGENKSITTHKESGCLFELNVRKSYFSPREGTERIRLCEKVKPKETVMVFFAGVGPFPIVLSKKTDAEKIIGIEWNPNAVKYFKKNIKKNKCKNVDCIKGDVGEQSKKFYKKCDRIIMPLPETGYKYIKNAINCCKKNGIIHFYCFSKENELDDWVFKIKKKTKRKIIVKDKKKVLPYGPGIYKYRIDLEVF